MTYISKMFKGGVVSLLVFLAVLFSPVGKAEPVSGMEGYFAKINGQALPISMLQRKMVAEARRFYHGTIPDGERAAFIREVADKLVIEWLLAQEAKRRGFSVDQGGIDAEWARLDSKNASDQQWHDIKGRLRLVFEEDWKRRELAKALLESVKDVASPSRDEVRAFYNDNQALFTEPAAFRASLILIAVDPSSSEADWVAAEQEAKELRARSISGEDFGQLAQIYSSDYTADQGGDMGVVHAGMVGENAQRVIESLAVGEVSEPIRLLQGVVVFKLTEKIPPTIHGFEKVAGRAESLWKREQSRLAEELLLFELQQSANVELNESVIGPLNQ